MSNNPYSLVKFVDHILKIDENGEFIPKRDEHGNIIINKITGRPEFVAEQEGTRLNARNMNQMDIGIFRAHERLDQHDKDIQRLRVQLELDGRAPGNSGTFADTFDDVPNKLMRLTATADITQAVEAGATVLPVDNVTGFEPFTQVTVFDGNNSEDTLITSIGEGTITVQALAHSYVKGARVARSTATVKDGQMVTGEWGTYSIDIDVAEVV